MGQHPQVPPPHRRPEVGAPRAVPPAPLLGGGHVADAGLRRRVDVRHALDPKVDAGLEIVVGERVQAADVGDRERAARAVIGIGAVLVVLRALEVGEHALEVPALAPERSPAVVVLRLAPDVRHAVDRAGAAQHLAARHVVLAPVACRVGLGLEAPVVAWIGERQDKPGGGHRDGDAPVRAAGLKHQHAAAPVLRQAVGDDAAGRSPAHDDVVPRHHRLLTLPTRARLARTPSINWRLRAPAFGHRVLRLRRSAQANPVIASGGRRDGHRDGREPAWTIIPSRLMPRRRRPR